MRPRSSARTSQHDRLDGETALAGPLREHVEQGPVGVDGDDGGPRRGEGQRDAAGPGAEVDDAAGRAAARRFQSGRSAA